jgi:hypothetical protein
MLIPLCRALIIIGGPSGDRSRNTTLIETPETTIAWRLSATRTRVPAAHRMPGGKMLS